MSNKQWAGYLKREGYTWQILAFCREVDGGVIDSPKQAFERCSTTKEIERPMCMSTKKAPMCSENDLQS